MKLESEDLYRDNLKDTTWLGEVMKNDDPEMIGRIKVKVFGKFDQLDTESIPWAHPTNGFTGGSATGSGFYSVPKVGSIVSVTFDNGNIYHPEYHVMQRISDELKAEIQPNPTNVHSLIYDSEESLKMYYTQDKGLMFDYKETQINIKPDNSIYITNPNGDQIELTNEGMLNVKVSETVTVECKNMNVTASEDITVDCRNATVTASKDINAECVNATIAASSEAVIDSPSILLGANAGEALILGDSFQKYFNTHTHLGNLGAPTGPPIMPSTPNHLSKVSKTKLI